MPIELFKKKNENVERISFKDFSDFMMRGYGKKVSVSIDGKIYTPAPDVTAALFATWMQAAENLPAASQESALPSAGEAKVPSPFSAARPVGGPASAPAKRSASQDVTRSLEELSERLEKLTASLEEFRAKSPEGAEAVVRDRLEGALSEKASEFAKALERSQGDAAKRLSDLKSEIVAEVERLADAADESRLTNEQRRKLVAEYRPGTIEEQRQRIESLRAELERVGKKNFDLQQGLQSLNLDLLGYKNDPTRVALATLKEREQQLDQRQKEIEGAEAVKVERNALFRRVNELEKLRDTYEANQNVLRQDERARSELVEVRKQLAEMESARSELEQSRDALAAERRKRAELATTASQQAVKLQSLQEDLLKAKGEAGDRLAAVVEREKDHARREKELDADFKQREAAIRATETRRTQWLEDQKKALEEESAKLKKEAERHAQERFVAENRQLSLERDQAVKERGQHQSRLDATEKELVGARQQRLEFESRREALQTELKSLQGKLEGHRQTLDNLEQEHHKAKEARSGAQAELEAVRARVAEERDAHEKALQRQNTELSALEQRRLAIEQRTVDRPTRLKPVAEPWGVRRHLELAGREEAAWLGDVRDRIAGAGFSFPSRVLNAFHTSLKISDWAPLTGLAGVSGTGKSELPRLYSHFGGLEFLSVPVQPNWDSPQDLFGFFNYMDGQFRATELLRALYHSQRSREDGGFADGLLLVLLDEMNRARFELYFSELLSRLESRRGADTREEREFLVDLGSGVTPLSVPLGDNLFFVGSLNEDDSTHSLVDMVLDRANFITFPRPLELKKRDEITSITKVKGALALSTWKGWLRKPKDLPGAWRVKIGAWLKQVNFALSHVNRAVGHRVLQAVEAYVVNYPETGDKALLRAFEDQLAQKVMPKLRGIDESSVSGGKCIEEIRKLLGDLRLGLLDDFNGSVDRSEGAFVFSSAAYLERSEP